MTKHTPIPWRVEPNGPAFDLRSPDRVDRFAMLVGMVHSNPGELEANAAHIVKCVNAHDELVAELQHIIAREDVDGPPTYLYGSDVRRLRSALAKVGVE